MTGPYLLTLSTVATSRLLASTLVLRPYVDASTVVLDIDPARVSTHLGKSAISRIRPQRLTRT